MASQLHPPLASLNHSVQWSTCIVLVILLIAQFASHNHLWGFSNWFIPDGITLKTTFDSYWRRQLELAHIPGSWGVNFIYVAALVLGVLGFAVTNLALLSATQACLRGRFFWHATLILFPYFLLAIALPSKDIVTLAASAAVLALVLSGYWVLALLLGAANLLVRDGAAVILIGFVGGWLVVRKRLSYAPLVALAMLSTVPIVSATATWLIGDLTIYARNIAAFTDAVDPTKLDALTSGGVWIRFFANLTNMAFRPAIIDLNGDVALLGVAYLVSGVSLLLAAAVTVAYLSRRTDPLEVAAALLFVASLTVVTINPLIQPRYMLPAAAIILGIWMSRTAPLQVFRGWLVCAAVSLLASLAYWISGIGLPPSAVAEGWTPW